MEAWVAVDSSNGVECGYVSQPVCLTVTGEGKGVPCSLLHLPLEVLAGVEDEDKTESVAFSLGSALWFRQVA